MDAYQTYRAGAVSASLQAARAALLDAQTQAVLLGGASSPIYQAIIDADKAVKAASRLDLWGYCAGN